MSEGTLERMGIIEQLRSERSSLRTELRAIEVQCETLRSLIAEVEAKIDLAVTTESLHDRSVA